MPLAAGRQSVVIYSQTKFIRIRRPVRHLPPQQFLLVPAKKRKGTGMIVQPHFLKHWKVKMLTDILRDNGAALRCFLGLWGHCQEKKADTFKLNPWIAATICCWDGDSQELWKAITNPELRLLDENEDGSWTVHEWREHNAQLTQKWKANPTGSKRKDGKHENAPDRPPTDPRPTPDRPENAGSNPTSDPPDGEDRMEKRREDGEEAPPPVEFPDGFPKTEDQAIAWVRAIQTPDAQSMPSPFIRQWWCQVVGQNFKAGNGQIVGNWGQFMRAKWREGSARWIRETADGAGKKTNGGGADSVTGTAAPAATKPWDRQPVHAESIWLHDYDSPFPGWANIPEVNRREIWNRNASLEIEPAAQWRGALAKVLDELGHPAEIAADTEWTTLPVNVRLSVLGSI